ncbi:hypothetical protein K438DRAFT_1884787 [Mycena galopus ATCC 62051]|nr:hypothetical protein K438DRAFT_1884787 [Mycena galopus ATCC 62051]
MRPHPSVPAARLSLPHMQSLQHPSLSLSALWNPAIPLPRFIVAKAMAVARNTADSQLCTELTLTCADTYNGDEASNATLLPVYFPLLQTRDIKVLWPLADPERRLRFLAILGSMYALASMASRSAMPPKTVPTLWSRVWP